MNHLEHYDSLLNLNLKIENFRHLYVRHNDENDVENTNLVKSIDPEHYTDFTSVNSLLFKGTSKKFLTFVNKKLVSFDQYTVVFTVGFGYLNGRYFAPIKYCNRCVERKKNNQEYIGCFYCDVDLDQCHFYDRVLMCRPEEVNTIDCHGDKCRNSVDSQSIHCWCTGCHGEFVNASMLNFLMDDSIKFADFPKSSVLKIIKNSDPVTAENKLEVHNLLQTKIDFATSLENRINNTSSEIQKAIESLLQQKEQLENQLEEHLEKYGSVESMKRTQKDLNKID